MSKINKKTALASSLAVIVGMSGCSKYEDGPALSFLTKKQRLSGDWDVTKMRDGSGDDLITNTNSIEMEFDDDGDFTMITTSSYTNYYGQISTNVNTMTGEWEFSSDKEEIEIEFDNQGSYYDMELEITKLTNKELEGELDTYGYDFDFEAVKQ
mgnify:CR=1 FL=1|tara:strand:- start:352 stop:813 length:462 start_codon:yes stop_codon:yes gene_type:complete